MLRGRLAAEPGMVERLVLDAMAALALRLPGVLNEATAWFAGLAAHPAAGPVTRLGALVQRVRCASPGWAAWDSLVGRLRLLRCKEYHRRSPPPSVILTG